MGEYVFKKDDAGIRRMLQSQECLNLMEEYARDRVGDGYMRPIIGYDRAKVFIEDDTND